MSGHSYTFSHALCRKPANSITSGLRAVDSGDPDPKTFNAEHDAYVDALRATGAEVTTLSALEEFPDSVFIEDTTLVLKGTAICLPQGAATRRGETAALRPDLITRMSAVIDLQTQGSIDGGDILCSDDRVMVGLSARTTRQGAMDLKPIIENLGYKLNVFETPKGVLHFKTDSALLDADTIFSTKRLAASGCFDGFNVIHVPEGEEAAANALRFNDTVFISDGHPKSAEILTKNGYKVVALPVYEAAKVDGGLSCMSLRYSLG